jgi:hypothetical protein
MIPQRFQGEQQKVAAPPAIQRLFDLYEQHNWSEADLASLLETELDLHHGYSDEVRAKVRKVIATLKRNIEAREVCKSETGIAAVPTRRETKIVW